MHYFDSVQKCRDATTENNQDATPFCRAAGLHRPRREIESDLKGTSYFATHTYTHTCTNENKRYKKYKRKVLLSFPFASVFAEDQLLNVLFSRTWLNLRGPLITTLHRPKEQCSTIIKKIVRARNSKPSLNSLC